MTRFFLVLLALLGLSACQTHLDRDLGLDATKPGYSDLYPYYAELCAASQFRKLPNTGIEIEGGGFGGHAVIYLNGVCKMQDAHYPVLKMCDAGFNPQNDGVGISVNDHYENANWIAVEGRDFFFHGLVKPGAPMTRADYDATVREAVRRNPLDGVVFRAIYLKARPAALDEETYKYQISFGTDYALNLARDRYCAKVPLSRAQMERAVNYLNEVNTPYREGRKTFKWSVVRNNCSHLYHNILSAAGVWPVWPVNRPLLVSAFSFPTPKNEFVNLARHTNDGPIDDLEALFADPFVRAHFLAEHSLPTQPGALVELERMTRPNAVYDPDVQLVFYDDPTIGPYQRRYERILSTPRYSDLRANLDYFAALYQKIEASKKPLDWYWRLGAPEILKNREDFARFYVQYYAYIARQRQDVARDLLRLSAAPNPLGSGIVHGVGPSGGRE